MCPSPGRQLRRPWDATSLHKSMHSRVGARRTVGVRMYSFPLRVTHALPHSFYDKTEQNTTTADWTPRESSDAYLPLGA